jgi:hypothetical protein
MTNDDYTEVPVTLALCLALWAGAVAAGTRSGVFARLDDGAYAALAAFATLFAVAVVLVDRRIRGWLARRRHTAAVLAAMGAVALAVAAGAGLAQGRELALAAAPWPPAVLFVGPLTTALFAALMTPIGGETAGRWRWGSVPVTSRPRD